MRFFFTTPKDQTNIGKYPMSSKGVPHKRLLEGKPETKNTTLLWVQRDLKNPPLILEPSLKFLK